MAECPFPWEIFDAETLSFMTRKLGIKRNLTREEALVFFHATEEKGFGGALADQIAQDLGARVSTQVEQNGRNGHTRSQSIPTTRAARAKPTPSTPSRRISSRKRSAPEPDTESLFLQSELSDDEEAEGDADQDAGQEGPESVSAIAQNTRRRGTKRVRVSERAPVAASPPARSTRSRTGPNPTSTSVPVAVAERTSPRRKRGRPPKRRNTGGDATPSSERRSTRRSDAVEGGSANATMSSPERRSRRLKFHVPTEDESTDGEDEVVDDDEDDQFHGPAAVAAALTRASRESRTPRYRGRPPSTASNPASSRAPKNESVSANAPSTRTRSKPPPATTSRIRSNASSQSASPRTSKRTIKSTAKGALLSPSKSPMSIFHRPIRPQVKQRFQAQAAKKAQRPQREQANERDRSETPKEVFYGVVLEKRRPGPTVDDLTNDGAGDDRGVQLDVFVANGLAMQNGVSGDQMNVDPVLGGDQEDLSSLGGSNKENDFMFRNVSESSEDPLAMGEEDAEGELENDAVMQGRQIPTEQEQAPRSPLQVVPQSIPQAESIQPQSQVPMPQPLLHFHPQPAPQSESQPQPQEQPGPQPPVQSQLQLDPQSQLQYQVQFDLHPSEQMEPQPQPEGSQPAPEQEQMLPSPFVPTYSNFPSWP